MDLSDAPDEARFRQDVRAWLEKSLPELPWPEPADLAEKAPFWRQWQAMLFEAGYAGLTWPREYGGQGLDERMRAILIAEIRDMTDDAGQPVGAEPHVRPLVADLWARGLVHHTISQRVISGAVSGGPPGPVASIGKLYFCPLVAIPGQVPGRPLPDPTPGLLTAAQDTTSRRGTAGFLARAWPGTIDAARAFSLPTMLFIVGLLVIIAIGPIHPLA
jgi:Acyl-CoA dehydrogenase, N-terminal domain